MNDPEPAALTRLLLAVYDLLDAVDATLPEAIPPLIRHGAANLLDALAYYNRATGYPERTYREEGV